jgi:hypothetical protein
MACRLPAVDRVTGSGPARFALKSISMMRIGVSVVFSAIYGPLAVRRRTSPRLTVPDVVAPPSVIHLDKIVSAC